jgi:hypothetical protein
MNDKQPFLIHFLSIYLFVVAFEELLAITGFDDPGPFLNLLRDVWSVPSVGIYCAIGICCGLLIASGLGLLLRKKWAKISSVVMFLLMIVSAWAAPGNDVSDNSVILSLVGKGLGYFLVDYGAYVFCLYALILSKSVKQYFAQNEEAST